MTQAFLSEMNAPLCTWLDSIPEEENTKLVAYKTNEILHTVLSLFSLRTKRITSKSTFIFPEIFLFSILPFKLQT